MYPTFFIPSSGQFVPPADIKLLLHFNEGNGVWPSIDSSPNNRTMGAAASAAASTAQKKYGSASLSLSGGSQYAYTVDASSDFNLYATPVWTLEGWMRPTNYDGNEHVVQFSYDANHRSVLYIPTGSHVLAFGTFNGTWQGSAASAGAVSLNVWTHFAVVKNDSNDILLFMNGVLVDTWVGGGTKQVNTNSNKCYIGTQPHSGAASDYFAGYIDDIRFTHLALYSADFTPPRAQYPDP